jgi:hypothetical protein
MLPTLPLAMHALYPALQRLVSVAHAVLSAEVRAVGTSDVLTAAQTKLAASYAPPAVAAGKKAAKKEKASREAGSAPAGGDGAPSKFSNDDVVPAALGDVDWASAGLVSTVIRWLACSSLYVTSCNVALCRCPL